MSRCIAVRAEVIALPSAPQSAEHGGPCLFWSDAKSCCRHGRRRASRRPGVENGSKNTAAFCRASPASGRRVLSPRMRADRTSQGAPWGATRANTAVSLGVGQVIIHRQ